MNNNDKSAPPSRRGFLCKALAGGTAVLTGPALAAEPNPANLPPNVADLEQDARRGRGGAALW